MSNAELVKVEKKLQELSPQLFQGFTAALPLLRQQLDESSLLAWAQEGLAIASPSSRSWEAAIEYFQASSGVAQTLRGGELVSWARWGKLLSWDSPTLACSFFKSSPRVIPRLNPQDVGAWAQLGKSLYQGTWRSGTLASAFFEASETLVAIVDLLVLEHFIQFLDKLAQKSPDLALSIVGAAGEIFQDVERADQIPFLSVAAALAETSPTDVKPYLRAGSKIITKVFADQRIRFLTQAQRLAHQSGSDTLPFIIDGAWALGEIDPSLHSLLLSYVEKLMALSPSLALAFLKNSPVLISRLKLADLDLWYQEGVRLYKTTSETGLAFFKLESSHSEALLSHLSCRVDLGHVVDTLQMYVTALTGKEVLVAPTDSLVKKKVGWTAQDKPTTEGMSIFLPGFVERYESKGQNFAWYKVASTHQSAHIEFASFEFDFRREAQTFSNLRPELAKRAKKDGHVTELERFFDLFAERKLAKDIFTAAEDARIDSRVCHEYRGLRPAYQNIQRDSIQERPPFFRMTVREAFLEIITRIGLGSEEQFNVPPKVRPHLKWCVEILTQLQQPKATVEDAAEATIRLYAILLQVPNELAPQEEWGAPPSQGQDPSPSVQDFDDPHWFDMLQDGEGNQEEQEQEGERPEVDYRGDFKPELVQLMMKMKMAEGQEGEKQGLPMTEEELRQLLEKSAELDITMDLSGDMSQVSQLFAHNLMEQLGLEKVTTPEEKTGPKAMGPDRTAGEPLKEEPQTFLYDEWDFRAGDYRPRWCRVRQKPMEEGTPDFYKRTLETHAGLVAQIKRQFELLAPEGVRKVKRLPDGEEYDMDAVIEAVVDAKAGTTPSEKIYWQRKKVERDVAIVFLLDMSASTAEIITEAKKGVAADPIPDNPRQYLAWLQGQRTGEERRYQRIIDIEKESIVLLIKALETMGDAYGIYGFSSYGRENVEFYTIKDLGEQFNERVKRRIDKIAPMHATRMGPAIRHATAKLSAQDAKTKIIFLVSDGRPQDQGYSRDGVEKEYAIHDTKMALNEAKRKQIVPFCLTVDKAGHGYLRTMCEDMGYEVVNDIDALPTRILNLYRRLAF